MEKEKFNKAKKFEMDIYNLEREIKDIGNISKNIIRCKNEYINIDCDSYSYSISGRHIAGLLNELIDIKKDALDILNSEFELL